MFQDYYADRTPEELEKDFGSQFAVSIQKVKPGSWQGPVESGYGWHLVFIDSVIPGRVPVFEEVESEVKTAWLADQKAMAWNKAYTTMRARYVVVLPPAAAKQSPAASASSVQATSSARTGRFRMITSLKRMRSWLVLGLVTLVFTSPRPPPTNRVPLTWK